MELEYTISDSSKTNSCETKDVFEEIMRINGLECCHQIVVYSHGVSIILCDLTHTRLILRMGCHSDCVLPSTLLLHSPQAWLFLPKIYEITWGSFFISAYNVISGILLINHDSWKQGDTLRDPVMTPVLELVFSPSSLLDYSYSP